MRRLLITATFVALLCSTVYGRAPSSVLIDFRFLERRI